MTENHFKMLESFKHTFLNIIISVELKNYRKKKKNNYRRAVTEAETSLEN